MLEGVEVAVVHAIVFHNNLQDLVEGSGGEIRKS